MMEVHCQYQGLEKKIERVQCQDLGIDGLKLERARQCVVGGRIQTGRNHFQYSGSEGLKLKQSIVNI